MRSDPLLYAAGVATAPIAASGLAAALAPGPTVGSVVIALMAAVLAYLGGVVVAVRFGARAGGEAGRSLAAMTCVPVLLGGAVAAALSGYAALAVISSSTLWAYRVGLVGARDRLGLAQAERARSAAALALLAGGPAVTRAALSML